MARHLSFNCSICHIICLCLYSIWNIQLQRNSLLLFTYALEVNHFTICVSSTKLHRLFGQLCRVRTFPLWYVTQQSLVKIVYFAMWKEWAFHCGTFEAFSSPFINSNCRHKQYYCLTECALLVKRSTTSHCITGSFESLHLWIVNVSLFLISRHIIERKWSLCVYEHSFGLQLLTSFEFVIHTEGNIIMQITCCVCVDKEKKVHLHFPNRKTSPNDNKVNACQFIEQWVFVCSKLVAYFLQCAIKLRIVLVALRSVYMLIYIYDLLINISVLLPSDSFFILFLFYLSVCKPNATNAIPFVFTFLFIYHRRRHCHQWLDSSTVAAQHFYHFN